MCGIAGILELACQSSADDLTHRAEAMARTIRHRGPDAESVWVDAEDGIALAHTRLSIIDLSPSGNQPMTSSCGRHVIAYNGEIYNAPELREMLRRKGRTFSGHSDTEVVLEGIAVWGVRRLVEKLIGMFAFAVWDKTDRRLTLVRDRMGIKPIYWGLFGNTFLFGSELKTLQAHPACGSEIDRDAVVAFLRHNNVPAPHCIVAGVRKLLPGTALTVAHGLVDPVIEPYWRMHDVVRSAQTDPFLGDDEEAITELENLLGDAVKRRMVADVPLGAFLSGGIDSSVVVALMQKFSDKPVRSFSIGFSEEEYNEAPFASAVADHLGTCHKELLVTPEECRDVITHLTEIYDEPFADASQIPTYLLAALTREHVTVSLSGDGGDELFGGYPRYRSALRLHRYIQAMPKAMRRTAAIVLAFASAVAARPEFHRLPPACRALRVDERAKKLGMLMEADRQDFYRLLFERWNESSNLLVPNYFSKNFNTPMVEPDPAADLFEAMLYTDATNYLPNDILTKLDRASMAVSLEARVPILDHRVVEFAWRLPKNMKIRNGQSKWILRSLLDRFVPRRLVERPKRGFGIPLDAWLRGPLKEWASDLMSADMLKRFGIFDPDAIGRRWDDHLSKRRNDQFVLWRVLMLQAWCQHNHVALGD